MSVLQPESQCAQTAQTPELCRMLSVLQNMPLPPYRKVDGADVDALSSPACTSSSLKRFLVARKGNIEAAVSMLLGHLVWRRAAFPIANVGNVAQIIAEGKRFRQLGRDLSGDQVLGLDFCWGRFLGPDTSALDCLRAALLFIEMSIASAEAAGQTKATIICYGGPPPMDFAKALSDTLEANYPERMKRSVIYPVPWLVASLVRTFLRFLNEEIRAKFAVVSSEAQVLSEANIAVEVLPEEWRGGVEGAEQHFEPDTSKKINKIMLDGIKRGRSAGAELKRELLLQDDVATSVSLAPAQSKRCKLSDPLSWFSCIAREDKEPVEPAPPTFADVPPSVKLKPCQAPKTLHWFSGLGTVAFWVVLLGFTWWLVRLHWVQLQTEVIDL